MASDHAGFSYKNIIKQLLVEKKYEVVDFGGDIFDPVDDYPDFLHKAGRALSLNHEIALSIVFGGSGVGESVLMNRYHHVRCLPVFINDTEILRESSGHDNVNSIAIGSRFVDKESLLNIVNSFLEYKTVEEDKYLRRIKKIEETLI